MRIRILFLLLSLLFANYAEAQTVDYIIDGYVAFIGGKKKWKKLKTITTSGEYNYGGIPFPFHTYAKAPDQYKFVVPLDGKYYAQAFDGTTGWKIDAFKNETTPTLLTGTDALAMANEASVELEDALINYQKKGHQAILEGKENHNGTACFKVKFIRENRETETYYFEDQSFELVMKTAISKNIELGRALLNISYGDYRVVDGIRIPFKVTSETDGQTILTITIDNVVINAPVDDKEFQP